MPARFRGGVAPRGLLRKLALAAVFGTAALCASSGAIAAPGEGGAGSPHIIAPLAPGDEPIVVTEHTIQTTQGPLTYEARAGRLPIRDAETGGVRGHMFFVAYVVKNGGPSRPLTFAWNGGPGSPSSIVHMEGLGPRRTVKDHMEDNAETLLSTSDLVFMDAMGTGFSRLEGQNFAPEFYNLRGDIAATAEFIRGYRTRFRAMKQPVFVAGESHGVFRAAGLMDFMTDRGEKLAGAILLSGDIPNIPQPVAFYDAMHVPARTATAFYYKRLPPELMRDRAATMREAYDWAVNVYEPALKNLDNLTAEQRDKVAADLARYIGMRPDQVDRKTLVIHAAQYMSDFFGGDHTKTLAGHDMRQTTGEAHLYGDLSVLDQYLRGDLGYATDLAYIEPEHGYTPTPGPNPVPAGRQFGPEIGHTQEDIALEQKYGEVTWIARDMPRFVPSALTRDKQMRVFVATGRFDPLNMCEGDVRVTAQLPPDQSSRIENVCYDSGHIMYRDPVVRVKWLADLARFETQTLAAQAAAAPGKAK